MKNKFTMTTTTMFATPKYPVKKHESGENGNGLKPTMAKKVRIQIDATLEKKSLLKSLSEIGTTRVESVKKINPKI